MVERYYSGDYNGNFCAICDELALPFYGIEEDFLSKNATPFVFYYDNHGKPQIEVASNGRKYHDDILDFQLDNEISRYNTLCGRFWDFGKIKLLTIWSIETEKEYLTSSSMKTMCDLLKTNSNIDIYNSKLIFEVNNDGSERDNIFPKSGGFYIYVIPISEYISKKMSSVEDVVKEYNVEERKRRMSASMPKGKYDAYDYNNLGVGYLGYHLLSYMDEEKKSLNENVLNNDLPNDIIDALTRNTTSIGNNPAIPDIYDVPFLLKVAKKRFEDTKSILLDIGSIDDFDDTEMASMLSKLINKCKEIERPFKDELEKICYNYVIDLFEVPDETVQLEIELKDKIDLSQTSNLIDPIDGDDNFEYDTVSDAQNIMGEVYKRRLLNALCMGEAIILSSNIDSYKEKIEQLSPELCGLYYKIIALNNYILFTKENIGITDKNPLQIGTFELQIGGPDDMPIISSQGLIFPVLLSETIRGFLELFISHGLPDDKKTASYVIGKSDFIKAEPWDMRLGPSLWSLFSSSFNDLTLNELPYLLKNISMLDIDKFNFLMKEVFAKTKKGRIIMSKMCNKAKNEIEYDKFTDKMSKMKEKKSMITDEYIGINEL